MMSSASAVATWRSVSRSDWTYCRIVNATSACPILWLRAFQSILASQLVVSGLPTALNTLSRRWAGGRYSSGSVITGARQVGCVAGPVASGFAHPSDGCGGCHAEKVGEDGGG